MRFVKLARLLPLLLLPFSTLSAFAGTGEVQFSLLSQTGAISPTTIWSPSVDGDYIIAAAGCTLNLELTYTDDQGKGHTTPLGQPIAIRVEGGTSPSVSAPSGSGCPSTYDVYIDAIAVNTSTDQQGGITEPYSHDWYSQTAALSQTTLLSPATDTDYLISTDATGSFGGDTFTVHIAWTDELGTDWSQPSFSTSYGTPSNPWLIHAKGGTSVTMTTTLSGSGSANYNLFARALQFGAPASGSGPLTSTELDLLNTSTVTYPSTDTVLTIPSSAEYYLLELLEPATNYCLTLDGTETGYATYSATFYANGASLGELIGPQRTLIEQRELGSTGYRFLTNTYQWGTNNTYSGPCPETGNYSVSGAAVQF